MVKAIASHQCCCSRLNPGRRGYMCVEFVAGSVSCSKRFFSENFIFPSSRTTNTSKSKFDVKRTLKRGPKNSLRLRG